MSLAIRYITLSIDLLVDFKGRTNAKEELLRSAMQDYEYITELREIVLSAKSEMEGGKSGA